MMATTNENDKNKDNPNPSPTSQPPASNSQGASGEPEQEDVIWVISNRKDDRLVLHERDPRHPGGEAFIGGAAPDKVFRTAAIERLLHAGEMIEIPEPPKSKKKPIDVAVYHPQSAPAQPGQAIQLGRKFDPEVVPQSAQERVARQQRGAPRQIASKATVPPPPKSEKEIVSS